MNTPLKSLAALVAMGFLAAPAASQAQQQYQDQIEKQQRSAPSFEEEDLKSYASAMIEVRKINQQYGKELQSAQSQEEQQAVRTEATQVMTQAIEDEGLSVREYNQIYQAAAADPDLANKVNKYVQEAQ